MTKQFKCLVGAALVFHAIGLFVLPMLPSLFSADTLQLMKYSGHGAHIAVNHPAIFAVYLLPYPALVGLLFFKNWARLLLLGFLCVTLFGSFVMGTSVSGPPESFVSFAATLLDGGIVALAFLSPLAEAFSAVRS